jgi:hypothetical protein
LRRLIDFGKFTIVITSLDVRHPSQNSVLEHFVPFTFFLVVVVRVGTTATLHVFQSDHPRHYQ